jgi:hypothetical protein
MESPIIEHEQLKRIDNIEDVAFERLFTNYLQLKLKNEKKLIDIESTNQESIVMKMGPAFPGMIYTFININNKNLAQLTNMNSGKVLEFHDYTPILFCTSYNPIQKIIKGLNLNMLPNEERLKFLQAFWEHYKSFFERIEEKTEYQKEALNKKYIIATIIGQNPALFKRFNDKYNALFNFAYRSYKLENIRNYRMIEYEEWRYIPFFNAKSSFKKLGMANIYQTYNINKNKT